MTQLYAGFLIFFTGMIGLIFNHKIDYFFQMMENSTTLVSILACLIGLASIAFTPIKPRGQTAINVLPVKKSIIEPILGDQDKVQPRKPIGPKESRIKLKGSVPKNTKGLIIDT